MSILAGGTVIGQGIVVLSSLVLTRLYTPEDFGVLAVFSALLGIFGVVASLRYQLAIPLPRTDSEAAAVIGLSLLTVTIISLLVAFLVFFYSNSVTIALRTPILADYLWFLPGGIFLAGCYQVFNYWAIRTKCFQAIAQTKIAQSLVMSAVQMLCPFLGPLGLILGKLGQQATGAISLGRLAINRQRSHLSFLRLRDISAAAGRYRRFPLYSTHSGLLNKGGSELPPILFALFFSVTSAGFYMLAHRVLALPMSTIGRAIADVFFSESSKKEDRNDQIHLVQKVHDGLVEIALPLSIFFFAGGPTIFGALFGDAWTEAGTVVRWLVPMIYAQFVIAPVLRVLMVMEQQAYDTLLQGLLFGLRMLGLVIGIWLNSFYISLILYAAGSASAYFIYLGVIFILSGGRWQNSIQSTIRCIPRSFLLVSPLVMALLIGLGDIWIAGAIGASLFLIVRQYIMLLQKYFF